MQREHVTNRRGCESHTRLPSGLSAAVFNLLHLQSGLNSGRAGRRFFNYKQLILFSVLRVSLLTNRIHKLTVLSLSLVD